MSANGEINLRQFLRIVLPTMICMAGILMVLKLSHAVGILPKPAISLFPDTAVLLHQSIASESHDPASIVLLGDSTCLMGVDARELSRELSGQPRVLSLALLVWLDLRVYSEVLLDFAQANPQQIQTVVLLVSPAKLAGAATDSDTWNRIHHARHPGETDQPNGFRSWSGLRLFRENIWSHLLDTPLEAKGIAFRGFSSQLESYQTEHQGNLIEPGTFLAARRRQKNEWRLSSAFEAETRYFKAHLPVNTKLFIGITPRPKSSSNPDDLIRRNEVLQQWNEWMHADGTLTNLPAVLPDVYFSATAHLNEFGQKKYTEEVAHTLATALKENPDRSAKK